MIQEIMNEIQSEKAFDISTDGKPPMTDETKAVMSVKRISFDLDYSNVDPLR